MVYDMIVPTSIDIMLPESTRAGLNTDDQKKAIDYMYGSMLDETKKVNIYDTLMSHNDEYLYFRTDHHWTALGAYYAYEEFAKAKGVKPLPLSKYEKVYFPDFLGSFYADTEKNPALEQNPDVVEAYIPPDTNDITCTQSDGSILEWKIVYDATDYSSSLKYNCFIGGDQPISVIHNPNLRGSQGILWQRLCAFPSLPLPNGLCGGLPLLGGVHFPAGGGEGNPGCHFVQ